MAILNSPPVNLTARPLLSRVAESAYWMSRYVERAEHVARVLNITNNSMLDMGDIDQDVEKQVWHGPMHIFMVGHTPQATEIIESPREQVGARVNRYLTLDDSNPNSIRSCITRARENARSIRENISSEMWENLNTLYWSLQAEDASGRFDDSASDLFKQVTTGSLLFQGLADQTLAHGQPWQFIQAGKFLERIDVTCRIIQTKFDILNNVGRELETTERNVQLISIIRSCCALEAFRRNAGEIDTETIASFLLLERNFPRSVCFSARHAYDAISRISRETTPVEVDQAEGILGRLHAELQFAKAQDVTEQGLVDFLQRIQSATLEAAIALKKSYFLQ